MNDNVIRPCSDWLMAVIFKSVWDVRYCFACYGLFAGFKSFSVTQSKQKQASQAIIIIAYIKSRSRKNWSTVVASLMLVACLVFEIIQY